MPSTLEPATTTLNFSIRAMRDEDIAAYVKFYNQTRRRDQIADFISEAGTREWLTSPVNHSRDYQLAHLRTADGSEGEIIGYFSAGKAANDERAFGQMLVHPDYRGQGLGRTMYEQFLAKTQALQPKALHFAPHTKETLLRQFLERRGYAFDRYFWDMRLAADITLPAMQLPSGFTLRTFVPGLDEQLLTDVRNITFADHYGSVPRTLDDTLYFVRRSSFHAEGVIFAFYGTEIAGYCLTEVDPSNFAAQGEECGWVHNLGVVPQFRRSGLGRALLLAGVNYLRSRVPVVMLGVEGKNAKALPLYESVGFVQHSGWANMRKELTKLFSETAQGKRYPAPLLFAKLKEATMTTTSELQFTITPMQRADLPLMVDFLNELEALEPTGEGQSLAEVEQWYDMPKLKVADYFARLVNEDGSAGRIVGHCGGELEEEPDAWSQIAVHPDYRGKGVGSALYQTLFDTVKDWHATALHIIANKDCNGLREFLTRRGFELERYFWQMRLDPETTVPAVQIPAGYSLRTFVRGQDEQTLLQVRNATFAEHYGSPQRTIEYMEYIVNLPDFHADGLFFAYKGDEVAGFCYTGIDPAEVERRGIGVGWIHSLGTMPAHRGVGLGRALLLSGVNYIRQHVPHVELGVEGKNANALGLYTSVGFYQLNGRMNLLKHLNTD